ncbi:hypothetical protein PCL_06363 [Purpureocillium lilacinum]|uniref:Uncharacterized protein n=1 Tax=Purpureocillium lilacinum TaxID=33203 RepID=A0A2U3EMH4_PURLI|nr:hypothetical protein PCL_06363 [Purpureocillium lilacinum]
MPVRRHFSVWSPSTTPAAEPPPRPLPMPQESFSSRWDAADAPLHPVGVPGSWSVWLGDWALPRTGYLSEKQCSSAAARASYLPPALLDLPVTCSAGREDAFQDIMTAPLSPFCPGCIFHFNCSAHLLLGQNPFPRVRSPWPGPLLLRATSSSLDKLVRVGSASLELDAGQEDTCMSRASPQKKCTRPVSHPSRASDTHPSPKRTETLRAIPPPSIGRLPDQPLQRPGSALPTNASRSNGTSHLHRSRDDVRFSPFLDRSLQAKLAISSSSEEATLETPGLPRGMEENADRDQ